MDRRSAEKTRGRGGVALITLRYFARIKDVTGKAEETLNRDNISVSELLRWAEDTYSGFGKRAVQVAINEEYANDGDVIRAGDVVAFLPPVSGG